MLQQPNAHPQKPNLLHPFLHALVRGVHQAPTQSTLTQPCPAYYFRQLTTLPRLPPTND